MNNRNRTAAALIVILALASWPGAAMPAAARRAKDLRACPSGMAAVGTWCVDKFEASVWSRPDCTGTQYGHRGDDYTEKAGCRDNGSGCRHKIYACSLKAVPANEITWFQAAMACANSDKELLPNAIWQTAALGTPDPGVDNKICNVSNHGAPMKSGTLKKCVSAFGVYDMAGNVWEWVADWGTAAAGKSHPRGAAVEWDGDQAEYGNDIMWSVGGQAYTQYNSMGWTKGLAPAVKRGGYWGEGPRAGIYAYSAYSGPTDWDMNTGFRCGRPR